MSNTSRVPLLKRECVFLVKQRVDKEMLVLFASIIVISQKEKEVPLVVFRTKGGLVNMARKIITLVDNFKPGLDFLVEEEASSAGILILPAGRKVFAKERAMFQWHLQKPDPRDIGISQKEYDKGDWSKAEYFADRSFTNTKPQVFFDLMVNKKLLYAEEMKNLGIVHEIIP
jgi:ATP-dependent protease ClpP protease subunit